jgi:hypothetical protein
MIIEAVNSRIFLSVRSPLEIGISNVCSLRIRGTFIKIVSVKSAELCCTDNIDVFFFPSNRVLEFLLVLHLYSIDEENMVWVKLQSKLSFKQPVNILINIRSVGSGLYDNFFLFTYNQICEGPFWLHSISDLLYSRL